ncbi:MAG: acyl carrier protein [Gammaproteobacteria bacterium]|nr:acyl carrier protein [Gammaproteobacteria bacterium]
MTTTFDGLREVIVRDYELPPEKLVPDTLLKDIDIDSLGVIELIFSLEEKFDITATDTAQEFNTLGDVADYIDRLIAERKARPSAGAGMRE